MYTLNILTYLLFHLLCIYGTTVILSSGMFLGLYLKLFKELAYEGKKFDLEGLKMKIKVIGADGNIRPLKKVIFLFGYNMLTMLINSLNYDIFKRNMLYSLKDYIVPLSEDEANIFSKHPRGLTAYLITKLYALGISTFNMNFVKKGQASKLKCLIVKDDLYVIKVTGYLKGKKQKELKQLVYDYLLQIILIYQNEFDTEEEMLAYLSQFDEFTLDVTDEIDLTKGNVFTYPMEDGEIIWRYTEDYQDFTIVTAFGEALNMSAEEQRAIIQKYLAENKVDTEVECFDANFKPCEKLEFPEEINHLDDEGPKLTRTKK